MWSRIDIRRLLLVVPVYLQINDHYNVQSIVLSLGMCKVLNIGWCI